MAQQYLILAKTYDKKGRLLSSATNSYKKTHPIQKYFADQVGIEHKHYLHAEVAAILRAKDSKIHRITIERYGKNGEPMLAAPCPICAKAIEAYGITTIEYTQNGVGL